LRLIEPSQPRLLITHGLSGSGKSWQTQQLLEQAGAIRFRSDVLRRLLPSEAAPEGRYSEQATRATYDRLHSLAGMALSAGYLVVVDATFLKRAERQRFAALAKAHGVPFHILHCQASVALLRQRIQERMARGDDASEADEAVLAGQMQAIDTLDATEQACTLTIDVASEPAAGTAIEQVLAQWRGQAGGAAR
jgi:predicted kinase